MENINIRLTSLYKNRKSKRLKNEVLIKKANKFIFGKSASIKTHLIVKYKLKKCKKSSYAAHFDSKPPN